jgi:hypothetical protein
MISKRVPLVRVVVAAALVQQEERGPQEQREQPVLVGQGRMVRPDPQVEPVRRVLVAFFIQSNSRRAERGVFHRPSVVRGSTLWVAEVVGRISEVRLAVAEVALEKFSRECSFPWFQVEPSL